MSLQDYIVDPMKKANNLCFLCKKATGRCCWSEIDHETNKPRYKPVDGWTAIPVMINLGSRRNRKAVWTQTYHILKCPEYEKG